MVQYFFFTSELEQRLCARQCEVPSVAAAPKLVDVIKTLPSAERTKRVEAALDRLKNRKEKAEGPMKTTLDQLYTEFRDGKDGRPGFNALRDQYTSLLKQRQDLARSQRIPFTDTVPLQDQFEQMAKLLDEYDAAFDAAEMAAKDAQLEQKENELSQKSSDLQKATEEKTQAEDSAAKAKEDAAAARSALKEETVLKPLRAKATALTTAYDKLLGGMDDKQQADVRTLVHSEKDGTRRVNMAGVQLNTRAEGKNVVDVVVSNFTDVVQMLKDMRALQNEMAAQEDSPSMEYSNLTAAVKKLQPTVQYAFMSMMPQDRMQAVEIMGFDAAPAAGKNVSIDFRDEVKAALKAKSYRDRSSELGSKILELSEQAKQIIAEQVAKSPDGRFDFSNEIAGNPTFVESATPRGKVVAQLRQINEEMTKQQSKLEKLQHASQADELQGLSKYSTALNTHFAQVVSSAKNAQQDLLDTEKDAADSSSAARREFVRALKPLQELNVKAVENTVTAAVNKALQHATKVTRGAYVKEVTIDLQGPKMKALMNILKPIADQLTGSVEAIDIQMMYEEFSKAGIQFDKGDHKIQFNELGLEATFKLIQVELDSTIENSQKVNKVIVEVSPIDEKPAVEVEPTEPVREVPPTTEPDNPFGEPNPATIPPVEDHELEEFLNPNRPRNDQDNPLGN